MAVKTLVSIEDYLGMSFEHDREFVHGEVVERGMPTLTHGKIQAKLIVALSRCQGSHDLHLGGDIRVRISDDLIRIPDVSLFQGNPDEVPTSPPLVAVEIASPDDRLNTTLEKLAEYRKWGVRHIWLVQPELKALFTYDGSLNQVPEYVIPELDARVTSSEIFS